MRMKVIQITELSPTLDQIVSTSFFILSCSALYQYANLSHDYVYLFTSLNLLNNHDISVFNCC